LITALLYWRKRPEKATTAALSLAVVQPNIEHAACLKIQWL